VNSDRCGSRSLADIDDVGYSAAREIALIDGWSTISTPGNGLAVPIGGPVDASGDIFVADTNNNAVREISQTGGNLGSVTVGSPAERSYRGESRIEYWP
jgi:hypothetical protein